VALTHHLADLESAAADPDFELVRLRLEAAPGEGERFDLCWREALRHIERREVASLAEDRQRSYAVRSLRDPNRYIRSSLRGLLSREAVA
jgi:hypothetical protein